MSTPIPPSLTGIHHFKFPVTSIPTTQSFYENILGFKRTPKFDHVDKTGNIFALIMEREFPGHSSSALGPASSGGGKLLMELRLNPEQAKKQEHWDPITWGVETKAELDEWKEYFEGKGVKCSKVFVGLAGWVLCALDPDGKLMRIYCYETHEWTTEFDEDEFWLPK